MKLLAQNRINYQAVFVYFLAAVISVSVLFLVMQLWQADLSVPFGYSGDALSAGSAIKAIMETGWYYQNPSVGMPAGQQMYDFPGTDTFHFLIIKVIALFASNYALVLNLFFLATFPLTTMTSLFVFRSFNISLGPSLVGSLLYTFLPYHFMRGTGHLFLASYYMVPLMVLLVLWIYSEQYPFVGRCGESRQTRLNFLSRKALFCIIICLLVASTGIYYAFFGCFFLVVAGISSALNRKRLIPLISAGILIAFIFSGVVVNIFPSMVYQYNNGKNELASKRGYLEAEHNGLKATQLLLPVSSHRIPYLALMKGKYDERAPLVNENTTSSLGIVGSLGFIALIALLLYRRGNPDEKISSLAELNLMAFLLGTIGGFGAVFALVVSPMIRSYNRISIYIAFFALFAVVLLFEALLKAASSKMSRIAVYCCLVFVTVIGVLDQTNKNIMPAYGALKEEFLKDKRFVEQVEKALPSHSMVFQLPYVPFPENPPVNKMGDYDHFRAYLHSSTLKWSYGAMKGREVEGNLRSLLKREPIVSENKRLVFYKIQ